jgi:hypothetical protein
MTELRAVPDPLVFPQYGNDWYAAEKFFAVTPGQLIHVTFGNGKSFDWAVPKGVTKLRADAFGR